MSKRRVKHSHSHSRKTLDTVDTVDTKELLEDARIIAKPRDKSSYHYVFSSKQLEINKNWLGHSFSQTTYQYLYKKHKTYKINEVKPFDDESTTKETNSKEFPVESIKNIIANNDPKPREHVHPGECINKNNIMFMDNEEAPTLFYQKFIKLTVGKCTTDCKAEGIKSGYFALYNCVRGEIASHPIPFIVDVNDNVKFTHPTDNEIFFFVPEEPQNYAIVCALYLPAQNTHGNEIFAALNGFKIMNEKKSFHSDGFKEDFIAPKYSSFKESLKHIFDRNDAQTLPYKLEVKTEPITTLPHHYAYSWSCNPKRSMVSWPIMENSSFPIPMITVSNITVNFKSAPKMQFVKFVAYFYESVEKRGDGSGARYIISNKSPVLVDSYESPVVPVEQQVSFPDFVNIVIDHELPAVSHIVIKIITYSEKTKKDGKVFGMSIIPLFDKSGNPSANTDLDLFIHETNKLPKNYLTKVKAPGKTFMKLHVDIPQAMLPNQNFKDLAKLDIDSVPEAVLLNNIIPLTSGLISYGTEQCFGILYSLYSLFDSNVIKKTVYPWIFDSFDPTAFDTEKTKLANKISTVFASYIKKKMSEDSHTFLKESEKVIPVILNILSICMVTTNAQYKEDLIFSMVNLIPEIIAKHMLVLRQFIVHADKEKKKGKKEDASPKKVAVKRNLDQTFFNSGAVELVKALSDFILNVINVSETKHIQKLVHIFMFELLKAQSKTDEVDNLVYLQFYLLTRVCSNERFIRGVVRKCRSDLCNDTIAAYTPLWSSILLAVFKGIKSEDPVLNGEASLLLARICLAVEESSAEICKKTAVLLIPTIPMIYENYLSQSMKDNKGILYLFIPTVMFVIGSAPKEVSKFFKSLDKTYKRRFITYLTSVSELANEGLDKKNKEKALLQQSLIYNLTYSVLICLNESVAELGSCIAEVSKLLVTMFTIYQPTSNVPYFYSFAKNLTKKHNSYYLIIKWLLPLALFKRKQVRCLTAALLVEIFNADYLKTKTITISSIEALDALTDALLSTQDENIPIYMTMMNKVAEVSKSVGKGKFVKLVEERVNAANTIAKVIVEQRMSTKPLDVQCENIMKIADQYENFPSTRYKWLLQVVDKNKNGKDYVAAFIAQLHVVTLIASVVEFKHKSKENGIRQIASNIQVTQPMRTSKIRGSCGNLFVKEDFYFFPPLLNEFTPNYSDEQRESSLLSDFTIELLIDAMITASDLGRQAGLFYTLRQIYAFLIRLYQINRDFVGAAKAYEYLAENGSKIMANNLTIYNNLNYFLVEVRDNKKKEQTVFCTPKTIDEFISNMKDRYKENVVECKNHSLETCKGKGICVVRLYPSVEKNSVEFAHCYNKFTTLVSMKDFSSLNGKNENIDQIEVTTKGRLPNYKSSAGVKSMEPTSMLFKDYVSNEVDKCVEAMSACSSEFEKFFPTSNQKDSMPEKYFSIDIKRIPKLINDTIKGINAPGPALIELKNFYPKDCQRMTEKISNELERIMKVYSRAVSESKENIQNIQMMQIEKAMVNDFLQNVDMPQIKDDVYEGCTSHIADCYSFSEYAGN